MKWQDIAHDILRAIRVGVLVVNGLIFRRVKLIYGVHIQESGVA